MAYASIGRLAGNLIQSRRRRRAAAPYASQPPARDRSRCPGTGSVAPCPRIPGARSGAGSHSPRLSEAGGPNPRDPAGRPAAAATRHGPGVDSVAGVTRMKDQVARAASRRALPVTERPGPS